MSTTGTGSPRRERDPDSLVTDVVLRVADVRGAEPFELPPLTDTIDPDALTRIFRPASEDAADVEGHLAFRYAGCEVVVYPDETLVARPTPESATGDVR